MIDAALTDAVADAMREAADAAVVPRFRSLSATAVTEKSPGDWVTDADHECEELLTAALLAIAPGVPVVGEEASARDPSVLRDAGSHPAAWVLDPVDGTKAFIDGSPDIATMVAFIEGGSTTAAWIWQPLHRRMFTATAGGGAAVDGSPLVRPEAPASRQLWRGLLRTHSMPPARRDAANTSLREHGLHHTQVAAAGVTYPMVCEGALQYALYWRTLPWDHAPGALIAAEAGAMVRRLDGSPYLPWDGRSGLLTATDDRIWSAVRSALPDQSDS